MEHEKALNSTRALKNTEDRLVASALDLFSSYWYETVSIAEICRNAGLSNGIFYKKKKKKEDIFKHLLEQYLSTLSEKLNGVSGTTVEERLGHFVDIVASEFKDCMKLVSVYREGQYRFPQYEKRLRDIYAASVSSLFGRPIDEAEYIFVVSGVRFVSIRSVRGAVPANKTLLKNLILNGVFTKPVKNPEAVFDVRIKPLEEESEHTSRDRLIAAGIRLFGKQGFYNVNVYDIAKEAGFSVGTFYLHFETKEAFLAEIVRLIGHRTRRFISQNLNRSLNRLEQELQGLFLFLRYFKKNKEYYSIVREAEFVVSKEAERYYDKFEEGYLKNLDEIGVRTQRDKRVIANAMLGISHFFGIEVLFSKNIKNEKDVIIALGTLLHRGIRL